MSNSVPTSEQVRAIVDDQVSAQYVRGEAGHTLTALEKLHAQLVEAAKGYELGPQMQRQAVCDAVMATSDFLTTQGFSDATMVPLNRVAWALVDLCKQNRPDPLFCEKLKSVKPKRGLEESIRQGHLAALANAWLDANPDGDIGENSKLDRAARHISGSHFGAISRAMLKSAMSYQRQIGHNDLIYASYNQMKVALDEEAKIAGGGEIGLRTAIHVQLKALNAKADLRRQ